MNRTNTTRVTTGIIFFASLAVFFIAGLWLPWAPLLYFIPVSVFACLELTHALQRKFKPLSFIAIQLGALTLLSPMVSWLTYKSLRSWHILKATALPLDARWGSDFVWLTAYGILFFFMFYMLFAFLNVIVKVLFKGPQQLPHAVAENAAAFYIAAPFACMVSFLFAIPNGYFWLLYALITPMIIDVAAYYSGSFLGRHKIVPHISPNKTWEGFIGGIFASVLFSVIYMLIFLRGETPLLPPGRVIVFALVSGLIIGIISQFGDWVASALKRWCEIKDFSNLLPGHGGILDRFDSLLFSLPAAFILAILFYMLKRGA